MYRVVRRTALFDVYALPGVSPSTRRRPRYRLRDNDSVLWAVPQCADFVSEDCLDTSGVAVGRRDL